MIDYTKNSLLEIINDIENNYGFDIIYITDSNVYKYYSKWLVGRKVIKFEPGEENKTLLTVENIYERLLVLEANKNTIIVGLGGGIVTDVAGYIASTFMRGLRFGFISTTLLGMVDASIGGKNGVNYKLYKNLIGTINEPLFIYISTCFLDTLPEREIHTAYGEIVKYAIGFDKDLFEILESGEYDIKDVIYRCGEIKTNITKADHNESLDIRHKLNLGHTIAHAIENKTYKYHHGECVIFGLYVINTLSYHMGMISSEEYIRTYNLIKKYDFVKLDQKKLIKLIIESIDAIKFDKKGIDNRNLDIVLIKGIGSSKVVEMSRDMFKQKIYDVISLINKD